MSLATLASGVWPPRICWLSQDSCCLRHFPPVNTSKVYFYFLPIFRYNKKWNSKMVNYKEWNQKFLVFPDPSTLQLAWPWTHRFGYNTKDMLNTRFTNCVRLTLYSKTQGKYSVRRVVVLVDPGPWGRRWSVTQGSGRQPTPDALFSGAPNTMLGPPLMVGLIQYHRTDCRLTKSSFDSLLPTPYALCIQCALWSNHTWCAN